MQEEESARYIIMELPTSVSRFGRCLLQPRIISKIRARAIAQLLYLRTQIGVAADQIPSLWQVMIFDPFN